MDQQKGHVTNLLENTWFFGNTLKNKAKIPKNMVRSNSNPSPSLQNHDNNSSKMSNNLRRTPSLPVSLGKDMKNDVVEEEEYDDEPRMGDLIRQAMPIQVSSRKLDRMSSLPPFKVANEESSIVSNVQNGDNLSRNVSVESSSREKGHLANMAKLTRGASIDSSSLPPKFTSKQSGSNSKNNTLRKQDTSKIEEPNSMQTSDKIKSQKSLSQLQIKELQGFKDLGFSIGNIDVSPNVTPKPPTLQRGISLDSKVMRRSYLPEEWRKPPSSPLSCPPSIPKSTDPNDSLSQDMKAKIKFWARAVASNVHQDN